jgi:DNA/RNA-binding domain of Phe-tRNA-synthetase-like protein
MKFTITNEMRRTYPKMSIGIVVAKNALNSSYSVELKAFVHETFMECSRNYQTVDTINTLSAIKMWREVYRSFGANPKKKKPTVESLLARTIRNNYIPSINPIVDAYLCAEIETLLPIGGYDLKKISGDIVLRFSLGNEAFMGVGAKTDEYTNAGEIVYADNDRILTRCWNYRDCEKCKIDTHTNDFALFVEDPLGTIDLDSLKKTMEKISSYLSRFCGADCELMLMERNDLELEIL